MTQQFELTDQRLLPARDALASGAIKVLSLDVFDTLLWRRVPEAADAFLPFGRALSAAGRIAPYVAPLGFSDLRRAAERFAREQVQAATGYREVTLADIHGAMPDHIFAPGFNLADRVQAELAFERAQMILDQEIVTLMRAAKDAGARVVLASDTYFTSAQLRDFLAAAGLGDPSLIDRIYASCEVGKPKYRDMFDVILKDEGVPAGAVLHVGDTLEADVYPCRARGIAVVHYDKWSFAPRVQTVEFPADRFKRAALLLEQGDFGLTGLRSRLAHRPPPALAPNLRPYWAYGAATLAPVFAVFARWVVNSAAQSGALRVFGLMREGRFLKRVVEATAKSMGLPMMVDELWLSRRAVIRAALFDDDVSLLPEAILLSPGSSTDEILASLGLARADLAGVLPPTFDFRQADALTLLSQAIAATPALKAKVLAVSAAHRANLLKCLGKRLAAQMTLLDLGYAATIQAVLARILKREGKAVAVTGLYLALNDKAMSHMRDGANLRGYLDGEGFAGATGALLSRTPDVLEHACMCREGSLSHYDDAGAPVLLPNQRDDAQLAQMEALQDGIIAGVGAVNALLGGLARTSADSAALKAQVAEIVSAALLHPTSQEAVTIGAWRHEANFDLTDRRRLTDLAFKPERLEYEGWGALRDLGRHEVYWPAAALTAAGPFLGAGFAGAQNGTFGPEHLTAGPLLGGLVICPDLGIGFDAKRQGAMPLSVNAFGRGQIQVVIKPFGPEAYKRLRLSWPQARAVMQIDHIGISYIGERQRSLGVPGPAAWSNASAVSTGAYLSIGDKPAEAVIDLGAPPSWPHALELTVRYKYLKLDPIFGAR